MPRRDRLGDTCRAIPGGRKNRRAPASHGIQESGGPYVIDIVLEKSTDCSMGVSIASIREFE
jgi:glyoxylate carboligase